MPSPTEDRALQPREKPRVSRGGYLPCRDHPSLKNPLKPWNGIQSTCDVIQPCNLLYLFASSIISSAPCVQQGAAGCSAHENCKHPDTLRDSPALRQCP